VTPNRISPPPQPGRQGFHLHAERCAEERPGGGLFLPSAYTGGAIWKAHTFAENSDKFAAAGANIIGVSGDDLGQAEPVFSGSEFRAPAKFPIASDASLKIAGSYNLASIDDREEAPRMCRGLKSIMPFIEAGHLCGRQGHRSSRYVVQ